MGGLAVKLLQTIASSRQSVRQLPRVIGLPSCDTATPCAGRWELHASSRWTWLVSCMRSVASTRPAPVASTRPATRTPPPTRRGTHLTIPAPATTVQGPGRRIAWLRRGAHRTMSGYGYGTVPMHRASGGARGAPTPHTAAGPVELLVLPF
jgi:hypothetical protein